MRPNGHAAADRSENGQTRRRSREYLPSTARFWQGTAKFKPATDLTDPNVTLQETIAVSNVTSTNGNGAGVRLIDTHSGRTASITNYTNGNATAGSGGGLIPDVVGCREVPPTSRGERSLTAPESPIRTRFVPDSFAWLSLALAGVAL